MKPTAFFLRLRDSCELRAFKLLPKLALALLTIYNSSSAAETDFSLMNAVLGDSRRGSTGHKKLEDRVRIKSTIYQCRYSCPKCEDIQKGQHVEDSSNKSEKRQRHCHCPLWKPSEELVASMTGGQPCRQYKEGIKIRREKNKEPSRVLD